MIVVVVVVVVVVLVVVVVVGFVEVAAVLGVVAVIVVPRNNTGRLALPFVYRATSWFPFRRRQLDQYVCPDACSWQ